VIEIGEIEAFLAVAEERRCFSGRRAALS